MLIYPDQVRTTLPTKFTLDLPLRHVSPAATLKRMQIQIRTQITESLCRPRSADNSIQPAVHSSSIVDIVTTAARCSHVGDLHQRRGRRRRGTGIGRGCHGVLLLLLLITHYGQRIQDRLH